MRKLLLPLAALLVLVGPAASATSTISIQKTGFHPANLTVAFGDTVKWKNDDTVNHQVVANNGSFVSPVLKPGQLYSHAFRTAGKFPYHDGLNAKLKATLHVNGPPPSLTLAVTPPVVTYGDSVTLSGQISTHGKGQTVSITAQPYGQATPLALTTLTTSAVGTFSFVTTPRLYTTYVATWSGIPSAPVIAQVKARVTLTRVAVGRLRAQVTAGKSLRGRHVFLQRLAPTGRWVSVTALKLGTRSGRIFRPAAYLPSGKFRVRVFLSTNQAGNGLIGSPSGTLVVSG